MRKPKTHFEQVPVNLVKKILKAQVSGKQDTNNNNVIIETPGRKTEPYSISTRLLCGESDGK
jgi:hypothetical protein